MKKTLLILLTVFMSMVLWAQTPFMVKKSIDSNTVVFDFNAMDVATSSTYSNEGDILETVMLSEGRVALKISPAEEGYTNNRFWGTSNGPQLRVYNGTLTFTVSGSDITKIVFDAPSRFGLDNTETGVLEDKIWTGKADQIIFNVNSNTQINNITVTYTSEGASNLETCSKPTINSDGNTISITTTTEGASIYYTLDGTDPTTESTLYTEPIVLTENCLVKAIAIKEGYNDSEIAIYDFEDKDNNIEISLKDVPFWQHEVWGISEPKNTRAECSWVINEATDLPYGDGSVNNFADLSSYSKLVVTLAEGSESSPRFLFNRDEDEGQWNEKEEESHLIDNTQGGWSSKYFYQNNNIYTVYLNQMVKDKGYAHLHAIKGADWIDVTIKSMVVYGSKEADHDVYSVVGAFNSTEEFQDDILFGAFWDTTIEENVMNFDSETGLYVWTKKGVTMKEGTIYYKIVKNHDWDQGNWGVEGQDGANAEYYVSEYGIYDIAIYFNPNAIIADGNNFRIELKRIEKDNVYTVVGAFNEYDGGLDDPIFGKTWAPDLESNDMVKGEDGIYTKTFENVTLEAGTIFYKIVENHSWYVNWGIGGMDGANVEYIITEAGVYDITIYFNPNALIDDVNRFRCVVKPSGDYDFDDAKYVFYNIEAKKYWGTGNDWDTQATLVEHPVYQMLVAAPNGKYRMETQVDNNYDRYWFSGDYMDSEKDEAVLLTVTPTAEPIGYKDDAKTQPVYAYTIADGNNCFGNNTKSTVLGKNLPADSKDALWMIIPLEEAKATIANATIDNPSDATIFIEDYNFNRNNRFANYWKNSDGTSYGLNYENRDCNAEAYMTNFECYQSLSGLPNGIYVLDAQAAVTFHDDRIVKEYDSKGYPVVFAGKSTSNFVEMTVADQLTSQDQMAMRFKAGMYKVDPVIVEVTDGTLRIGAKSDRDDIWACWDNFVLTYYGNEATIDQVKAIVKQAEADEISRIANEILPKMKELTESTNVYTQEAYDAYYGQWYKKYEAGTLTRADVMALEDPFVVTGWHANVAVDNFLLSAWDTNPDFNDASYYINTWSTEGIVGSENYIGAQFGVPFIEYYYPLEERVLTATMNGLEAGWYDVTALVRVRVKDGDTAPAYGGIKMQANKGDWVDVTAGKQISDSQYYMDSFTAKGEVSEDGVLKIKFIVSDKNNIDWLAFKDVKFAKGEPAKYVYTVVGAFNEKNGNLNDPIFGKTWGPDLESNDMVKGEDGIYTKSFEKVSLSAGTIYYKVVKNHDWLMNWGIGDDMDGADAEYIITKPGVYNISFYFNPDEPIYEGNHLNAILIDSKDLTCSQPTFTQGSNNTLLIKTVTEGAVIYYTLDGKTPTRECSSYKDPILLDGNCTIKAIAVKEGYYDSEVAQKDVDWFKVANVEFMPEGTSVKMRTATEGAKIFYTIDGSAPTAESTPYNEEPLSFDHNVTIKAIGIKDRYKDSEVTTYEYKVDDLTTAKPTFTREGNTVTIATVTEGAAIYYTMDGTTPVVADSLRYSSKSIELTHNCMVKAIAVKEGLFPSAEGSFPVDWFKVVVRIIQNGTAVEMEATPDSAQIHYTTDGSEPTATSALYNGPFSPTTDMTIRAIAFCEGFNASEIAEMTYRVGVVTVAAPEISPNQTTNTVTITTATSGATIYYTLDGSEPTTASSVSSGPVALTHNCTVKAFATCEGYYDSYVTSFDVTWFQAETPIMALDHATGRLTITCSTAGNSISYSIGGGADQPYSGPVTLKNNSTVRAWATAEDFNRSEENTITPIPNGTMEGETFRINGTVTGDELLFLRNIMGGQMEHLDMEDATLLSGGLADEAFAGMGILSARLPKSIATVGERLFSGCQRLAAVVWNATTALTASTMEGINNPNLLLYVGSDGIGRSSGVANLIVNHSAKEITLSDPVVSEVPVLPEAPAVSDCNFYCPIPFTANRISYSHVYKQQSGMGGKCQGWETIALPFTVKDISHRVKGTIAPFGSQGSQIPENAPRFWLYKLGSTHFEVATTIEANMPYIISMPEHPDFAPQYCLGNDTITFSATNAEVPVTNPQTATFYGTSTLHANFTTQAASSNLYVMNIGEKYDDDHLEGSIFVRELRAARPFEAYITTTVGGARYIELFGDDADSIMDVENGRWPNINGHSSMVNAYDLSGRRTTDGGRRILPHKRLVIKDGKVRTAK